MWKLVKILIAGVAVIFCLLVLIAAGAFFYIKTDHFRNQVIARTNDALPGQILVKNHRISPIHGKLSLENLLIKDDHGELVASAEKLTVKISYPELLRGRLNFIDGFLQKPWVKFEVKPDGSVGLIRTFVKPSVETPEKERLPEKSPRKKKAFNLIVQQLRVEDGIFKYEQVSKNFHAEFEGIQLTGSGNLRNKTWNANLETGKTTVAGDRTSVGLLSIQLEGRICDNRIEPLELSLKTEGSALQISAAIRDLFSKPVIELDSDLKLSLAEVQKTLSLKPEMTGTAMINLTADGPFNDPELKLSASCGDSRVQAVQVEAIDLSAHLVNRVLSLKPSYIKLKAGTIFFKGGADFRKAFPDGFFSSNTAIDYLSYDLAVNSKGLNLKGLYKENDRLEGNVDGSLLISGNGVSPESATISINLDLTSSGVTTNSAPPTDFMAKAMAGLGNNEISLKKFSVQSGETRMDAMGIYGILSQKIEGSLFLDSKNIGKTLVPFGVTGSKGAIDLDMKASGTLRMPLLEIALEADSLGFQKVNIGSLALSAILDEQGRLRISRLLLENNGSRINGEGSLKILEKPGSTKSFTKNLPEAYQNLPPEFILSLKNVTANDFLLEPGVSGTLSGEIKIAEDIRALHSTLDLLGKEISAKNFRLGDMIIQADFSDGILDIKKAILTNGRSQCKISGTADISVPDKTAFLENCQIDLNFSGDQVFLEDFIDKFKGTLSINGKIAGSLANPEGLLKVRGKNLEVNGKSLGNAGINLNVKDYQAQISGSLNFDFSGTLNLKNKDFTTTLNFSDTNLTPYLNMANLSNFSGFLTGKISASGNLAKITALRGDGQFSRLALFMNEKEVIFAQDFSIKAGGKQIGVSGLSARLLREGHLNLEGTGRLGGQISLKADGNLPLEGLSMLTDALPDIGGTVRINAQLEGTMNKPEIKGEILFNNIAFTVPELHQRLHDLNGRIIINPNALKIEKFQGKLDSDGNLELTGKAELENLQIKSVDFDLLARSLLIKIPDTADILLQSELSLTGTGDKPLLAGEILILEGLYYKDMNIGLVEGVTQKQRRVSPEKRDVVYPLLKNLRLNIFIKRRNPFQVDNNLANLNINPDLRIVGTINQPVIRGRTSIESGTISYKRTTFNVEKGIIDFINPYEPEPYFDIVSTNNVRKWIITLKVSGTPGNLRVSLSSEPPEEDMDILSLLVLGRTTRELIKREGGTARSTEQMMAEIIASTFGEDIKAFTGLDIIDVGTGDQESPEDSERVQVTLGKKLSERLTVKYAIDTKAGEMVRRAISEYKFLENIILSTFQDSKGVLGGEVQLRLEFR